MATFNPTSTDTIQNLFAEKLPLHSTSSGYKYVLRKNIAYNCQYLEHLNNEIKNIDSNHIVIQKIHYKLFIVISFSIIEGILYHALKKEGLVKNEEYKEKFQTSNDKNDLRVKTYIYEKIPVEDQITEEFLKSKDILRKSQDNNLLGTDSKIYSTLNTMRKFRDKIHLHISSESGDTDYNSFDNALYERQKQAFKDVLMIYFSISEEKLRLQL